MTKGRTTITVDRDKVEEVRRLTNSRSVSAAIDVALDRVIRTERLRKDVEAYTATPPDENEIALAAITPNWSDLDDDIDWESVTTENP